MPNDPRAELRALARWHTCRRAVDDLLGPLLEYGPVAVDRVADRIATVQELVLEEQRAFEAFVEVLEEHRAQGAVVLEMFGRRDDGPDQGDT